MQTEISRTQTWSAVGSMALCVALLIASEFMPVSLLTPIAHDLGTTEGMAGQTIGGRFDRRHVLMGLTVLMLVSLVVIAEAPNLGILMVARALLGIADDSNHGIRYRLNFTVTQWQQGQLGRIILCRFEPWQIPV